MIKSTNVPAAEGMTAAEKTRMIVPENMTYTTYGAVMGMRSRSDSGS